MTYKIVACTTDSDCTDYADGTGLTVCDTSTGLCDSPDTCSDDTDCPTVIGSTCDTSSGSCSDPGKYIIYKIYITPLRFCAIYCCT